MNKKWYWDQIPWFCFIDNPAATRICYKLWYFFTLALVSSIHRCPVFLICPFTQICSQRRQDWPNLTPSNFPSQWQRLPPVCQKHPQPLSSLPPPTPWLSISDHNIRWKENLLRSNCAFVSTKGRQGAQLAFLNHHLRKIFLNIFFSLSRSWLPWLLAPTQWVLWVELLLRELTHSVSSLSQVDGSHVMNHHHHQSAHPVPHGCNAPTQVNSQVLMFILIAMHLVDCCTTHPFSEFSEWGKKAAPVLARVLKPAPVSLTIIW